MTVVLTNSLLLLAYGCGPDVNPETDWAIGEYSSVGSVGSSIEVSDRFSFDRFVIQDDRSGQFSGEECGAVTQVQEFEWMAESDNAIRLVPPDGAKMFDNLPNTSFLLHRATGCAETNADRLAVYFIEWLNNGDLEGGREQPVYR